MRIYSCDIRFIILLGNRVWNDTQSVNIGQTSRREASAGCFHDRENERLLCYFLHPLAGSRKKVTAASSRRFLSTGFKALYGRVFL